MRKTLAGLFLLLSLLGGGRALAQDASMTGHWILTVDFYGTPIYFAMDLEQQGDKITGNLDGDKLQGTLRSGSLQFLAKDEHGGSEDAKATMGADGISGTVVWVEDGDPRATTHSFTAKKTPAKRAGGPQRFEFVPTIFYRRFSAEYAPVLTMWPGDTVHTTTVDAGGTDEKGVTRVLGGNPQTGPFYVETANPGDTLAVHITRLRLNRDYAISDDGFVERAKNSDLAVTMKDGGKEVRWHLDLAKGQASLEKPGEHLKNYTVPVRPMLGCVGVASRPAQAAYGTGDSGRWGGNMDFNEITEGTTVYLPVSVPGALLYVGDGHAVQGDGELNGNALETSMDVEFSVDVIAGKGMRNPRVESADYLMAMGLEGSIDDAFRTATSNMADWLTDSYKLTAPEWRRCWLRWRNIR